MKISISALLGDGSGRSAVDVYLENVTRARTEGFERMWSPQLPWEPDLLSVLVAAFRDVPEIEIGVAVLPVQVAHPMLLAQRALTLSLISQGRFRLGLGLNHATMSEELWGVRWGKPIRRMKEYLDGLLPLLAGQQACSEGELVTTRGSVHVPGASAPPVYLAAMGPQMLRLAGHRAAGTITWMTGPKAIGSHIDPLLREAATSAKRDANEVKIVAMLPVCVTDDLDAARATAAQEFAIYGTLPSYRAMMAIDGHAGPPDAALIGDESAVSGRIDELRDSGVDEFVGLPFGDSEETLTRSRHLLLAYAEKESGRIPITAPDRSRSADQQERK